MSSAAVFGSACSGSDALVGAQDIDPQASEKPRVTPNVGGSGSIAGGERNGSAGAPSAGAQARAGAGGTEQGTGSLDPVVGALDGRVMQFPCGDDSSTDDCSGLGYVVDGVVHECAEGKSEMVLDHPISGPPGSRFLLSLHFYGFMEPRDYGPNVVREAQPGAPDRNGGTPTPWATAPAGSGFPATSYDSYELLVHDAAGVEVARHYLNASPDQGHWTMIIDYEKTIEVEAGGFVRLRRFDNNCRLMKNCGATGLPDCAPKARTIDLSVAKPAPPLGSFPAGLNQPGLNRSAGSAGQWWMVDVTAITPL